MLRLADLEQSKNALLHSLGAASSQESYGHAIDEFIGWYCSEPRLAFNRTVALRYRFFLEQKNLAPSTINVRLAAVRRLAAVEGLRVFGYLVGQELEGNKPAELQILGLVHHAHPAAAQLLHDAVVRNGLADHWRESYFCETGKSMNALELTLSEKACC